MTSLFYNSKVWPPKFQVPLLQLNPPQKFKKCQSTKNRSKRQKASQSQWTDYQMEQRRRSVILNFPKSLLQPKSKRFFQILLVNKKYRMETDEKEERLPCGMKPEFTNFSFDQPSSSTAPAPQSKKEEKRLPNGQRAEFSNFSFDDKPKPSAPSETKQEELYPFKDFKFPEKSQKSNSIQKVEEIKEETINAPPVVVPEDRNVKIYDNSAGVEMRNQIADLGDDFFEGNNILYFQSDWNNKFHGLSAGSFWYF